MLISQDSLDSQAGRLLLQNALDADDNVAFVGEMFGDVFPVLIIELADHAFGHDNEMVADLSFLQEDFPLLHILARDDAGQQFAALDGHLRETPVDRLVDGLF